MDWYKKSEAKSFTEEYKGAFIRKMYESLPPGRIFQDPSFRKMSWEIAGSQALWGDNWIQVYLRSRGDYLDYFMIERYYDNEQINDDRHKISSIKIDYSKFDQTLSLLKSAIEYINRD